MAKTTTEGQYSLVTGLATLFNIFLGTGLLALPLAFAECGPLVSSGIIALLALCAYKSYHDLLEAMSVANFLQRLKSHSKLSKGHDNHAIDLTPEDSVIGHSKSDSKCYDISEQPCIDSSWFEIKCKFELAELVDIFSSSGDVEMDSKNETEKTHNQTNRLLTTAFSVTTILYLSGSVVIYNTMIGFFLRELTCSNPITHQNVSTDISNDPCWSFFQWSPTRFWIYRIYIAILLALVLPLTCGGLRHRVTRALLKYVQLVSSYYRFYVVIVFLVLPIWLILYRGERDPDFEGFSNLTYFHPSALTKFIGVAIFGLMCHHSVPGILTPIANKRFLISGSLVTFCFVAAVYIVVPALAVVAFRGIAPLADVYLMNFQQSKVSENLNSSGNISSDHHSQIYFVPGIAQSLLIYPLVTMFSGYLVVAMTLSNTYQVLYGVYFHPSGAKCSWAFPVVAVLPAVTVAMFTEDVRSVVALVGGLTGGFIQYGWPVFLGHRARVRAKLVLQRVQNSNSADYSAPKELNYLGLNRYASPFGGALCHASLLCWWALSVALVMGVVDWFVR